MLAFRHLAAGRAVHELRLEHDHGIWIADRRREQSLRVCRRRGDRHLHAGRVHVVGLGRIVVQLGRADAAAVRHPQRDRELHLTPRPPAVAADVVDQLVEAGIRERVVLHLADGAPSGHAQPDRRAEDPRLRQRRVDAAVGTEPVEEPCGRPEDTAGPADVLAHHQYRAVPCQLGVQAVVHRLDERQLSQANPHAASAAGRRTRTRTSARDRPVARPPPPRCPPASSRPPRF